MLSADAHSGSCLTVQISASALPALQSHPAKGCAAWRTDNSEKLRHTWPILLGQGSWHVSPAQDTGSAYHASQQSEHLQARLRSTVPVSPHQHPQGHIQAEPAPWLSTRCLPGQAAEEWDQDHLEAQGNCYPGFLGPVLTKHLVSFLKEDFGECHTALIQLENEETLCQGPTDHLNYDSYGHYD